MASWMPRTTAEWEEAAEHAGERGEREQQEEQADLEACGADDRRRQAEGDDRGGHRLHRLDRYRHAERQGRDGVDGGRHR